MTRRTALGKAIAAMQAGAQEPGLFTTFTTIDFSASLFSFKNITARLARKGKHAYIYVDTTQTVKDERLEEILSIFDNQIYPTNLAVFGPEPEPGTSDDRMIAIVFTPIESPKTQAAEFSGYFWPGHQVPQGKTAHNNQRERLHINVAQLKQHGVRAAAAAIAQELQYLIHWNHDRNEEMWLNAGLSEYAAFINGFGPPASLPQFLRSPNRSLTSWSNRPEDFARSFLWILYLAERFGGGAFIRELSATRLTGLDAIAAILHEHAPELSIEEVFSDWILANYLNVNSKDYPELGYLSIDLPPGRTTKRWSFLPVSTIRGEIFPYAAEYCLFAGGRDLILKLDGTESKVQFRAKVVKLTNKRISEISDFPVSDDNNGILPLLDFGAGFDEVLLVPYSTANPVKGERLVFEIEANGRGGPATFRDTLHYHDTASQIILPFGFPTPLLEPGQGDGCAVRFTSPHDGVLLGAEFGFWDLTSYSGKVRGFVRASASDSTGRPGAWLDSLVLSGLTGRPGELTWYGVDLGSRNIAVEGGEDFFVGLEIDAANTADTLFVALDTAKTPTGRSFISVIEDGKAEWRGFANGYNLLVKVILSVPADLESPEIIIDIVENPAQPDAFEVAVFSARPLDPSTLTGTLSQAEILMPLEFAAVSDSNLVFTCDALTLSTPGPAEVNVSARHVFGSILGTDTLVLNVDHYDPASKGSIHSPDNRFQIKLPPGVLDESRNFVTYTTDLFSTGQWDDAALEGSSYVSSGLEYTVRPGDLTFNEMVEVSFDYLENADAMLSENNLTIAFLEEGECLILGGELYREEKAIRVLSNRTGTYSLVIKQFDVLETEVSLPERFFLQQNYPNPFNPKTTIKFGLPESRYTTLRIVNLKGQIIATLLDGDLPAGEHVVEWDGTDDNKVPVASGVYLYQLKTDTFVETKKLVLVK
ncbi:MAG: T9SS type A sorting domain-containing protein [bacterium]